MARGNKPVPVNVDVKEAEGASLGKSTALVPLIGKDAEEGALVVKHDGPKPDQPKVIKQAMADQEHRNFDEEISGINLSKLFSVYAPQSAEGKRKKRAKHHGKQAVNKSNESVSYRTQGKQGLNPHVIPMDYNETAGHLPGTVKAASTNKDVTSPTGRDGSDAQMVQGSDHRSCPNEDVKMRRIPLGESHEPTLDNSDSQDSDYTSDEDEEPLIIQLMESMFTRKKTVQESEQMAP